MEENVKNHVLTYSKGLSTVPSDLVCDDDSLEVCENMTLVDGEWKVVQKPEIKCQNNTDSVLMFVHCGQGYKHEISKTLKTDEEGNPYQGIIGYNYYDSTHTSYYTFSEHYGEVYEINAVGNTLIVNTDSGLYYYIWKYSENKYSYLGNSLPDVDMEFCMGRSTSGGTISSPNITTSGNVGFSINWGDNSSPHCYIGDTLIDYENLIGGLYSEALNTISNNNEFAFPFFVVYALELYDGTYTKASNPVLMLPCCKSGMYLSYNSSKIMSLYAYSFELLYKLKNTISKDWYDIVKGVTVFASREISMFDNTANIYRVKTVVSGNVQYQMYTNDGAGSVKHAGIYRFKTNRDDSWSDFPNSYTKSSEAKVIPYKLKSDADFKRELESTSIFYKLFDAGNDANTEWASSLDKMETKVVSNLVTQKRLDSIDYYSHCRIIPERTNTFNRRLNAIGIKRGFFGGFKQFEPQETSESQTSKTERTYITKIYIKAYDGERRVYNTFTTSDIFHTHMWFYYPDPRAYHAEIYNSTGDKCIGFALKEHKGLNGAYHFSYLPNGSEAFATQDAGQPVVTTESEPEIINNFLLQSEVDNPFVFNASGYVRVGQGEIIGLAGLTTALSQDAYKVATTIAFTTQGIWALQIDATGQYSQVAPPFSREVCKNAKSITMVDNAVFFVSEKGLMCITGTTEQGVICVSKQLHGNKAFMNFLLGCEIAYDYTDSMLLLYKPNSADGLVYNIENGVWSEFKGSLENKVFKTAVADYPDYLVQNTDGKVFSLMEEPYRVDDVNVYSGKMVSRPLKLDGSMFMKSLRQVKNMKVINNGTTSIVIKGSNDLINWTTLTSVKGQPFKFFKIEYTFTNIKAVDSFAGTAVASQVRYTEKFM